MIASISGFLLLASDGIEGGFANGYMGTKGLLTAFLAAFITVNIYKVCVKTMLPFVCQTKFHRTYPRHLKM